jgi:hypothetical protein
MMETLETVGVIVFATLLQLPFHLAIALPWLLAAWIASLILRKFAPSAVRIILVSGIAAVGLAPIYGFHLSMVPAYWLLLSGYAEIGTALVSYFIVWLLLIVIGFVVVNRRGHKLPPPPNSSFDTDVPSERRST